MTTRPYISQQQMLTLAAAKRGAFRDMRNIARDILWSAAFIALLVVVRSFQ